MTWNWMRLGDHLRSARKAKKLTQGELASLAGVSLATVQAIEGGKTFQRVTPTVRTLERLVDWEHGSAEAVLEGGEPTLADAPTPTPSKRTSTPPPAIDTAMDRLPPRIRAELEEGQVLDTGVYDLSPKDSDVQLLVVVKGPAGATPEEIRRYMARVRRAERVLRQLGEDDGE